MSLIQSPHGVTYNGEQAMELIWIPAVTYGGMDDFFKFITDVKVKQQVTFATKFDKITTKDAGCGSTPTDKQIVRTEKFWDPQPVEALLSQCYTDLYGSSFEKTLKGGTEKYNLEGTEVEALMLEAMVYAGDADLKRMIWLGNKSIIGSDLTLGAGDVKNYDQVNGLWQRLVAAATALTTPRFVIAENAATTTAGQLLAAGRGSQILRGVFRKQSLLMKQQALKDKRFFVSREVYENYSEELAGNVNLETSRTALLNGQKTLTFEGIPLEIVDVVDTYLASDFVSDPVRTRSSKTHTGLF